jgi:hypothetical protein
MPTPIRQAKVDELRSLSKGDLHDLADGLVLKETGAIEKCVEFILAETKGNWHGRARAMMCRRLKNCELNPEERKQLVTCISDRLVHGNFGEQFYDQLRLAMRLDQKQIFAVAQECIASPPKEYVRRFALWILKHDGQTR